MAITIGISRETFPGERRVAMTPRAFDVLAKTGARLIIEAGAGNPAGFPDSEFQARGAQLAATRAEVFAASDVILQVRALGANPDAGLPDLALMKPGQTIIGMGEPLTALKEASLLAEKSVTSFAMELIPRITRAQSMDVLSSMATIAGYKAVLIAANLLPRMFPMLTTAAGTIAPAKAFILGAGVAGLQAIATARRLGAVVSAYDVRPAVKEQIESLGGKFVSMEIEAGAAEDKGGYAKAMGEDFYKKQRELLTAVMKDQDVVISTAAVPGKRAPILITADMVRVMAPGSVIVDLAAERGGNCELTKPGETVVENGVSIVGPLNVPASIPYHASQMYSRNLATFLKYLLTKDGNLQFQLDDEICKETMVTHQGKIVHPKVAELLAQNLTMAGR